MQATLYAMLTIFLLAGIACNKESEGPFNEKKVYDATALLAEMDSISKIQDSVAQLELVNALWDSLISKSMIPFISNDTVVFLIRSGSTTVHVAGDMTRWSFFQDHQCKKLGKTDTWYLLKTFPKDARLDYKIVENKNTWKLDPNNPKKQLSGFGYNSAFSMPDYDTSRFIKPSNDHLKGKLSNALVLNSSQLNRMVRYWVYTPAGYEHLQNIPSMYVVDGQEYKTQGMGCMIEVLDNMIAEKLIMPVLVVFVDPIHPVTGKNQRVELFLNNEKYAEFFKEELVPQIDRNYKTENNAEKRSILGTSYGGNCAAYFGYKIPGIFKLIASQSPAFNSNVLSLYTQSNHLDFNKVCITTGVIYDTEADANRMEQLLILHYVPYRYIKVNEGHSWGNWSALLDDILLYFYGY